MPKGGKVRDPWKMVQLLMVKDSWIAISNSVQIGDRLNISRLAHAIRRYGFLTSSPVAQH